MKRLSRFTHAFVLALALASSLSLVAQEAEETKPAAPPSESKESLPVPLAERPRPRDNLARLPYAQLLRIAQSDMRAKPDADSYRLRIQSRIPSVKTEDIELYFDIQDKPLYLPVDGDGFFEVPHTAALVATNPDLVANQPRGSLDIFVDLEVPKVSPPKIKDGKVAYQELFRPLVEIQNQMRKVDPTFGLSGQQQLVLEIETGEAPIKITRALGSRTFRPNPRGKVYMLMESYLYEENPQVEIPDNAKMNVLPVSTEEAEEIRSR